MSHLARFGRLILNSNKVFNVDKSFFFKINKKYVLNIASFSKFTTYSDFHSSYKPFDESVDERRCQAKRSVLVQVNSELSFPELHSYCSQFGTILGVHHYALKNGQQHFMLVEFETEKNASDLVFSGCFSNESDVIPVKSSFLWFRSAKNTGSRSKISNILNVKLTTDDVKLTVKNGCHMPADSAVMAQVQKLDNVSDQIMELYNTTQLDDLGVRLRYMVARQIECALKGLYPDLTVRPFGSSVNGFGKMGCDLDLILRFAEDNFEDANSSQSRLVFHTKRSTASGRMQQQRHMEIIGDIIQLYIPGCNHVRRILQARIPIIKYNQEYAGVECDLSMASMSGVYMTELLYTFGYIDERVRPLVFCVRKWAEITGLTNPSPGRWITNFPLTLMVLFFLQNTTEGSILPSFNSLKKAAGKSDLRITEDQVNCSFVRDISKINHKRTNTTSLHMLLFQFFEFYSQFDFSSQAISINEGKPITKLDHSPLYIVNPLEVTLNVSKNVSLEECERLRLEVRNAAWQLESLEPEKDDSMWGLPSILIGGNRIKYTPKNFTPKSNSRLVKVQDLFNETNEPPNTDNHDILEEIKLTDGGIDNLKSEIVEMAARNQQLGFQFKNPETKSQISRIKNSSAEEMKKAQRLINNILDKETNRPVRRKTRRR